tara:strand:- start:277 stop:504 length:228 start_codon:yes stop_codon:yes gene_type:complete
MKIPTEAKNEILAIIKNPEDYCVAPDFPQFNLWDQYWVEVGCPYSGDYSSFTVYRYNPDGDYDPRRGTVINLKNN